MIIVVWGDSFGLPHIVPAETAMSVTLPYTQPKAALFPFTDNHEIEVNSGLMQRIADIQLRH
jgi:hypothetical protein